jgi:hypothetical protein
VCWLVNDKSPTRWRNRGSIPGITLNNTGQSVWLVSAFHLLVSNRRLSKLCVAWNPVIHNAIQYLRTGVKALSISERHSPQLAFKRTREKPSARMRMRHTLEAPHSSRSDMIHRKSKLVYIFYVINTTVLSCECALYGRLSSASRQGGGRLRCDGLECNHYTKLCAVYESESRKIHVLLG